MQIELTRRNQDLNQGPVLGKRRNMRDLQLSSEVSLPVVLKMPSHVFVILIINVKMVKIANYGIPQIVRKRRRLKEGVNVVTNVCFTITAPSLETNLQSLQRMLQAVRVWQEPLTPFPHGLLEQCLG